MGDDIIRGLHPNQLVRKREGPKFFGLGTTQIDEKIKTDPDFPKPFPFSDTGRATGWTGQQIIDHQRRRQAKAKAISEAREGAHARTS